MNFINEPLLELRRAPVREQLVDALAALDQELPWRVPVLIDGIRRDNPTLISVDPGQPDRIVAEATTATHEDVDAAVKAAAAAAPEWEQRGVHARAAILSRAAGELRKRRPLLAALAVRECGKPWAEADADVCEAIDFLEYYAQQAVTLAGANGLVSLPGERNTLRYAARGVVAVVGPWNFPLAIPAGMVAAGLATGNGVVLKPAEQSPASALAIVEAFHAAGVPKGALNLLPGEGDVGANLVAHPGVHTIAFTGSGAVGLADPQAGRRTSPPASATSSASWPRWAARTASSSTPTPTSTRPSPRSPTPRSASPARSAPRPPARSCTSGSPTRCSSACTARWSSCWSTRRSASASTSRR